MPINIFLVKSNFFVSQTRSFKYTELRLLKQTIYLFLLGSYLEAL